MSQTENVTRRQALQATAATSILATSGPWTYGQRPAAKRPNRKAHTICAFIKFIQSLPYKQLAETVAELGFDGIEATVRDGGHVLPERVEDDLPKLVEALKACNLDITIMASSVNSLDQPNTKKVLRTASKLGITRYRLAYYRYDLKRPILKQLEALKPVLRDLTAFHKELGLQGLYQNHAGATTVGAPIWDLQHLMRDYSPKELAIAFDIRHATVEGGLAWPLNFQIAKPHLGAVYAKDFSWQDGRTPRNVPLGSGQVNPRFFQDIVSLGFTGPISLHVEYLPKAGIPANIKALATDLATLRKFLS